MATARFCFCGKDLVMADRPRTHDPALRCMAPWKDGKPCGLPLAFLERGRWVCKSDGRTYVSPRFIGCDRGHPLVPVPLEQEVEEAYGVFVGNQPLPLGMRALA